MVPDSLGCDCLPSRGLWGFYLNEDSFFAVMDAIPSEAAYTARIDLHASPLRSSTDKYHQYDKLEQIIVLKSDK